MSTERIEAIYDHRTGQLLISHITTFEEADKNIIQLFAEDLLSSPVVMMRLERMGYITFQEKLRQYIICLYGGNDDTIDIDLTSGIKTPDYCHCGKRGASCPGEGFEGLCSSSTINSKRLSRSEVRVLELTAKDLNANEIADSLFKSIHTIRTQTREILRKLEVHSIGTAIAKAAKSGII